ncbi:MAG TPA: transcription-repair coupling factor [Kofleriaceae bacterium]|nr:transcription-repair coupling factor [Kofleriaceae bacterium]
MWAELHQALTSGATVIAHGATAGWSAWLAAQLPRIDSAGADGNAHGGGTGVVVVVAADDQAARRLEADIRFFWGGAHDPAAVLDEIAVLPGIDVSPYADLSPDRGCIVERMATLYRLTQPALRPRIVVTSAEALVRRTMAPGELAARGTTLRKGGTIDRDELAALLIAGGWARTPVVDEPGTFAVRGGVIDVYAPLAPHPVRIELFGDEIESLRWFEAESQRTLRPIDWVHLHPVRETITTGARDVRTRLREYADEIAHPSKATRRLIEQLESGDVFVGIEGLTPAFHDELVAPAAYVEALGGGARWLVVDPEACRRVAGDAWAEAEGRFAEKQGAKQLLYPPARHLVEPDAIGAFTAAGRIELPSLELHDARPDGKNDSRTDPIKLRVEVDDLRTLKQELDHARTFGDTEHAGPLVAALGRWRRDGLRVAIACDSQSRNDRLFGVLSARGVEVRLADAADPQDRPGAVAGVTLIAGAPAHSFASLRDGVAIVTAADVFGQRTHHAQSKRRRAKDALLGSVGDFSQLAAGDYLVHQRHGVGRYLGLKKLAVGTTSLLATTAVGAATPQLQEIDTLQLEYDGGTLYLPVYRLGEVQRYVGAEGHAPKLDKLGGVTWEATRSKVARHVRALAEELLQLYAQRAALPGHAFPPADDSFRELEATFPFDETPDQAAAIDAVLGDMESPRAMDRLVCGDVGYGKTEVALRAIFRAVQGGKQACVLAPTTVLVEQHFRTMTERFGGFPVTLGKLSRFQSKAEQIETVKKLAEGRLDIVVGTHRLLSADVRWKDLGLLVIDEEQRFGVAHKERIKKTRTQVDVLTLTATPIPRTLHLAMANLRDLSIIATPPADRRAVRTFVSRVDDVTIREAIERELGRGGQVFFITPTIGNMGQRVRDPRLPADGSGEPHRKLKPRDDDRTILAWAEYLQGLVPAARIGVGHGGLSADELEKVMLGFVRGELDVLVATTIVESGLDIPRANTMFIARADAFGLAQLYQLRGRIGRSRERAYCYLLVPEPEHITEEARRRLETLQRFTELGAGFQIASQDLEIRGGGELLGAKQSGSIAAVGFDQYVKMLDSAVAELGGKPIHAAIDPELSIETPGFIPDDYVPDPGQRLELYKRLSAIETDDDLRDVMAEIIDRYGPSPPDVDLLAELMGVKAIARGAGVLALEISTVRVAVALPNGADSHRVARGLIATGWRKLPDGRYAIAPPAPGGPAGARRALLDALARAT